MKKVKNNLITFRASDDLVLEMARLCKKRDRSRSSLIQYAIQKEVDLDKKVEVRKQKDNG